MQTHVLRCGDHRLNWAPGRPLVMGIVNVTSDSFSGDGLSNHPEAAFAQAVAMIKAGADLVDVGAESTRPGAIPITADQELDRLLPILERLQAEGMPVSVDTYKATVMAEAIRFGVGLVNDISALGDPLAAATLAPHGNVALCLMHMQGRPSHMQQSPVYSDVVTEVKGFLDAAVARAESVGVHRERLILDPGFGFGKTFTHNQTLFRALPDFVATGLPVLVGVSRKSMIGEITGRPVDARVSGSVAAALIAAQHGAAIVRVHDVAPTVDALKVAQALGPNEFLM
jgi:dihydropteroate synthase